MTPEGYLVCAGDVPENAVFRVASFPSPYLLVPAEIVLPPSDPFTFTPPPA